LFVRSARRKCAKKIGRKRREAAKVLALTASRGVSSKWLINIIDAFPPKWFPFSR
jgi:hypothetical protein